MFKKWRTPSSSSTAAYIPTGDAQQNESLLEYSDDIEQDLILTEQQQKQFPLLIYWIYFAYGIAILLPWNVFITASDYFSMRFKGSAHQENFQNYFSAFFNCSNLVSLAVLLWTRRNKNTANLDVIAPLFVNLAIFAFFALTSLSEPTESAATTYFWITIGCMVLTGITTSVIQLSVMAETSQLLPKYMQAVMSGQGAAGVSVAMFSLLTILLFKQHQLDAIATFYYFISALLVTLLALMGRFALHRQPAYQLMIHISSSSTDDRDTIPLTTAMDGTIVSEQKVDTKNIMWDIITRRSTLFILTVIYIYIITLSLFPSITVLVQSVNGIIDQALFVSLHFLLFNIGDWIGRTLPILTSCQTFSGKILFYWSLSRTLFIPILFNCNLMQQQDPLLNSDVAYFVAILLFAISNGWLTSLVFMAAPRQVDPNCRPLVGSIISFFLVVGLALGGLCSFVVSRFVS